MSNDNRPNVLAITMFSAFLGALAGASAVYFSDEKKQNES